MNEKGLTSEEVKRLIESGKANDLVKETDKSIKKIFISNIFTYFNAIFCLLSVLLIIARAYKNLTFLVVIVINLAIGIIQQIRSKKVLDKLALLDVSEYKVIRDGVEQKVLSNNLVLGDVIKLESGQQVPADAIVISGNASVNESLLTGEEDEVLKYLDSELKSGSFLVTGSVYAKLTNVGKDSYASKLTLQAKVIKEKKTEMIRDIETIIKIAGFLIIPIGLSLIYQSIVINGGNYSNAIVSMVGAVIGMIPEGLYLLVTIALALSTARLAKKNVLLHDMKSIESLARVDIFCVDKTGTITTSNMTVTSVFGSVNESDSKLERAKDIMASYIQTIPDNNQNMTALREYFNKNGIIKAKEIIPFDSKKKYSCIKTNEYTYKLGAPEYIVKKEELALNQDIIDSYTKDGKRVLALVEEDDNNSNAILFIALKNDIRENAASTFNYLQAQGVSIRVISGDNPVTVSAIAKEVGIVNAEMYIDATVLDTEDKISEAVKKYIVFGRVKPEQKKQIIEAIKRTGKKVAMTGDGINDILAMKEADCSIAMSEGSDAARQAAQVVLLDSDFSHMQNIIYEGRRIINNVTRSATLFLYKNIFSLLLAVYAVAAVYDYPLKPTQVSAISFFNVGLPAFLLALEKNEKKQSGRFISKVLISAIPAAVTSFFAIIAMIKFADLFDISNYEVSTACIYLVSTAGFNILWFISRPLKKYNYLVICLCVIGMILASNIFSYFFDIDNISIKALALCMVFAIAEMTVIREITFGLNLLCSKYNKIFKKKTNKDL